MDTINKFRDSVVYGDFRLFYNTDTYIITTGKLATRYLGSVLDTENTKPNISLGFSDLEIGTRTGEFVQDCLSNKKLHQINFNEFISAKKKPETKVLILFRDPQEKTYSGLIQDFYISLEELYRTKKAYILTDIIQKAHIPLDPYQFIENLYPILQLGKDSINPKTTKVNILTGEEEFYKEQIIAPHLLSTEEFTAYVGIIKSLLYEFIKNALIKGEIYFNHCSPWCIDAHGLYKYFSIIYPNTKLFDLDDSNCPLSDVLMNEYGIPIPEWDAYETTHHIQSNKFGKKLLEDILFTELKENLDNHLVVERLFYEKLRKLNNSRWAQH